MCMHKTGKNHSIIITGASCGLGRALAKCLADEKRYVIAIARDENKLKSLASDNTFIKPIAADINDRDAINYIADIAGQYQPVHLVQNAAVLKPGLLTQLDYQDLQQVFNTNIISPILLLQALTPFFHQSRILHINSGLSHFPLAGVGSYCITKAAFYQLFQQINVEYAPENLICGSLLAPMMNTEMPDLMTQSPNLPQSLKTQFLDFQKKTTIYQPETVAAFAKKLLLKTSNNSFQKETKFTENDPS